MLRGFGLHQFRNCYSIEVGFRPLKAPPISIAAFNAKALIEQQTACDARPGLVLGDNVRI